MEEITMLSIRHNLAFAEITSLATLLPCGLPALGAPPVDQVNVVNPATMPALTSSVDDPGRIPYQLLAFSTCTGAASCDFDWPQVPSGYRLVIKRISGTVNVTPTPGGLLVAISNNAVNNFAENQFLVPTVNTGTEVTSFFNEQALLYVNQGNAPHATALVLGGGGSSTFTSDTQLLFLIGYLLDCTANHCASIAP
jgi:hypothetical protein